eukprot:c18180_g1_i3.p2 GENE.c18180_g1_i3~~c18180_g1_i3.p2  ORF type:complete len:139 (-),score=9.62 c18180_g1_i3:479-895(-)
MLVRRACRGALARPAARFIQLWGEISRRTTLSSPLCFGTGSGQTFNQLKHYVEFVMGNRVLTRSGSGVDVAGTKVASTRTASSATWSAAVIGGSLADLPNSESVNQVSSYNNSIMCQCQLQRVEVCTWAVTWVASGNS